MVANEITCASAFKVLTTLKIFPKSKWWVDIIKKATVALTYGFSNEIPDPIKEWLTENNLDKNQSLMDVEHWKTGYGIFLSSKEFVMILFFMNKKSLPLIYKKVELLWVQLVAYMREEWKNEKSIRKEDVCKSSKQKRGKERENKREKKEWETFYLLRL